MKYLSFSLWGDNPIYNEGIKKNCQLWPLIYEDWQMVVFFDGTVPEETIKYLNNNKVICVDMSNKNIYGMFWRFFAVDLPDSEFCVFRDADSRISYREKLAVDEWISSGKSMHVMRDHPYHMIPAGNNTLGILGGMWGIKSKKLPLTQMILGYSGHSISMYGEDQRFLKEVYDKLKNDRKTHDPFFEKKDFPIKREQGRFVGERIDINDQPINEDYKLII